MLHRAPRWYGDRDLLLVIVVAAAALELGAGGGDRGGGRPGPHVPADGATDLTLGSGARLREGTVPDHATG